MFKIKVHYHQAIDEETRMRVAGGEANRLTVHIFQLQAYRRMIAINTNDNEE